LATSIPLALVTGVPVRALEYANQLQSSRFDPERVARASGVENAVILVRESWGAEVLVRMWALGISRADAEFLYPRADTCHLYLAVRELESEGADARESLVALRRHTADSNQVVRSTLSPDGSERVLPGAHYPPICAERLREDNQGFTVFPPFLLAGRDGNRYLRDLRDHTSVLAPSLRGRSVFLMYPPDARIGTRPILSPLEPESLSRQWVLP
jgi:hypothetical protein